VGGSDAGEAAAAEAMGLLTEHAYSLLRVVSVARPAGGGGGVVRLVQLRNPWGKLEWRGDWSDLSPLWTAEMRAALRKGGGGGGAVADDGTFWMSFEDMLDYFRSVEACRIRPGWAEVRVRGSLPVLSDAGGGSGAAHGADGPAVGGGVGGFEVEVIETTDVEVSLMQCNGRGNPAHEMADLLLIILRQNGGDVDGGAVDGWQIVSASERLLKPSVTCEAVLTQGRYHLLPLSLRPRTGRHASPLPYVLRIGSAKPLLCEATAVGSATVRAALAAYVRSRGDLHTAFDGMALYSMHDSAGWLTYAENRSSLARFSVRLEHEGSFNVLPSRGGLATYDVLPPGHGQLLQCLSVGGIEDGCRMQCSSQFTRDMISAEMHSPEVGVGSIHSCTPLSRQRGGTDAPGVAGLGNLLASLGVRFVG
jgi:calpain-15